MAETILIVEDEPDLAGMLGDVLAEEGYRVVLSTPRAAALHAAETHPSVIVLDYVMPGLSGAEVLAQLRRANEGLPPVLLVSGLPEAARLAAELQTAAYLRKPFDVDEFVRLIAQLAKSGGSDL